jgi:hypothetical protein
MVMDYSKPESISLGDLLNRIKLTDLIPSRTMLLDGIDQKFKLLSQHGINTFSDLQNALKNPKRSESFSQTSGLDAQYLVLLRREVESYIPKPFKLKEIDWIPEEVVCTLSEYGINDSDELLSRSREPEGIIKLSRESKVNPEMVEYLSWLADLGRVQWVSPTFARILIEADCKTTEKLASVDADKLYEELDKVNSGGKYFNGKIGLRDVKRLVNAAGFIA